MDHDHITIGQRPETDQANSAARFQPAVTCSVFCQKPGSATRSVETAPRVSDICVCRTDQSTTASLERIRYCLRWKLSRR